MKKITILFACFILAAALLCACASEEAEPKVNDTEIVGTWEEDFFDSGYIFNSDGTGTDTFWNLTFTYTAYDGELTLIYDDEMWGASTYTYTISGKELTMHRTDEDADDFVYEKATASKSETTTTAADEDAEGNAEEDGEETTEE